MVLGCPARVCPQEQPDQFGQAQLPLRRPLDQREERPQLLLGGHQRGKAGAQQARRIGDGDAGLAAPGVGGLGHAGTTAPELSRLMV